MPTEKKNIFISHIADEHAEANRAKEFLERTFGDKIEVFLASSWESIQPGDDWFERIAQAITACNVMLVFVSTESAVRPWISFETGAGWFSKKKVIPVCHKGMVPGALPEPIRRLQAVDINAPSAAESLSKLAEAIRIAADLPMPTPVPLEELPVDAAPVGGVSLRAWMLRPTAHVGKEAEGVFKVGQVDICDIDRAQEAHVDPNESLFVRLMLEPGTLGLSYLNAIAPPDVAPFFEQEDILGKGILAKIKLQAVHQSPGEASRPVPIVVIKKVRFSGTD